MKEKRVSRVFGGILLLLPCAAAFAFLAGCAGTPAPAEEEPEPGSGRPAASDSSGPSAVRPEVLEILKPVRVPPRIALPLPDPVPAKRTAVSPDSGGRTVLSLPAKPSAPKAMPATPRPEAAGTPKPEAPKAMPPIPRAAAPKPASAPPKPEAPKPSPAPPSPAFPPAPGSKPAAASVKPEEAPPAKPEEAPAEAPAGEAPPPEAPPPSRVAEAYEGSPLELPFRGSGWVYLGETGGREGIQYESRKFDGFSAVFRFAAEKAGEYTLRFQRQDPVSGEPESLLVKVTVREPELAPSAGTTAETAAVTPGASTPESPADAAAVPPEDPAPVPAPPRALPSSPEELLRLARSELAAAKIASVLEVLDRYMSLFPFGSDEAFYLYGKAYEHNTPYRDIKKAYGYYKRLREEWPRSPFWRDASERVLYIERHYFDIR